jgi:Xaa-Pro aminopeptidase
MDYPERRRRLLVKKIREERLDGLLVSHPINVSYLTGFTGDSSYLLLGKQHALLVSDARFTEQIAEECPGLEAEIRPSTKPLPNATAEALAKVGFRTVGFESSHLTVASLDLLRELAPGIDWKPGKDRVERLRVVKDTLEIEQIREAVRIAERAFAMFRASLRADDREKDLADAMEQYVRRAGGQCTSFPSIIACGPRAALPHAPPTQRAVSEGGMLLVDWGAAGTFCKSDLTRVLMPRNFSTFSRSTPRERSTVRYEKVYAAVLAAQQRAIDAIRPGATGHDVDAAARSALAEAGLEEYFVHGLGHGIGMQVHEAPSIRKHSTDVLEAGMVVTIEPGVYLPEWGGVRLEDDILVTPDGHEVLSQVPKDLASSFIDL